MPPGLTKFRPHDEQMSNYIFRWKHDQVLASSGGKADFREPAQNTQAHMVLMAIAITVRWLNDHPECGVAAWLMSQVTIEQDDIEAGEEALVRKAKCAMQDPEMKTVVEEHHPYNGRLWYTWKVALRSQPCDTLAATGQKANGPTIEQEFSGLKWFHNAASDCCQRWAARTRGGGGGGGGGGGISQEEGI